MPVVGPPGNLPLCPILICQASSSPGSAPATSCTPSCCTHRCSRSSSRNVLSALLVMLPWNSSTLVLTRYWALSLLFMPFALCSPLGSLCYPRYQHSPSHLWQGWCPWSYTGHSLCSIRDRPRRRTAFPFLTPSPSSVSRALNLDPLPPSLWLCFPARCSFSYHPAPGPPRAGEAGANTLGGAGGAVRE